VALRWPAEGIDNELPDICLGLEREFRWVALQFPIQFVGAIMIAQGISSNASHNQSSQSDLYHFRLWLQPHVSCTTWEYRGVSTTPFVALPLPCRVDLLYGLLAIRLQIFPFLLVIFFLPPTTQARVRHIRPSHKATMADQEALIRSTYQASAATWPFTAISTILFSMRVFSRVHLHKDTVGWDDLVISLSWVRSSPRQHRCAVHYEPRR